MKDLLGLGKVLPIDKLFEVVSKAVGRLSKPYFDRKDIDTKAYEITKLAEARAEEMKIISAAVNNNAHLTGGIEYKEEKLIISSPEKAEHSESSFPSIEDRTQQRINFQEVKRQKNIESITAFAAEELKSESEVTNEPLNEDWTTRFFRIAEDVSNEEMQALWGKILAGEVKRPKSYSLRTLELIRNLSQEEAKLFIKVADFAISSKRSNFIYKGEHKEIETNFSITYPEIALLVEVGLLQPGDFVTWHIPSQEKTGKTSFVAGKFIMISDVSANEPEINIPIYLFTHSGNELLQLISISPPFEYLKSFAEFGKTVGLNLKYSHITERKGTKVSYKKPLKEF